MNQTPLSSPPLGRPETVPSSTPGTTIPRLLHQTFMSKTLPDELQQNVDRLQQLNPGWVYRLYDDADITDFISAQYGTEILRAYERINPRYGAARADLFRYLLLYHYGGVYLDIKSTCTKPLDECLQPDDQYVLAHWRNKPGEVHEGFGTSAEVAHIPGGEYQQWHLVAAPGHPFLQAVVESVLQNISQYRPWRQGTGGIGVLRLTGPLAYTLAIQPLLEKAPHRVVANETELGLQYSVYKNGSHRKVYKSNYGRLTESIVHLERKDQLWASLYSMAKKSKHLLFGQ